jgi:hypothetical protein
MWLAQRENFVCRCQGAAVGEGEILCEISASSEAGHVRALRNANRVEIPPPGSMVVARNFRRLGGGGFDPRKLLYWLKNPGGADSLTLKRLRTAARGSEWRRF